MTAAREKSLTIQCAALRDVTFVVPTCDTVVRSMAVKRSPRVATLKPRLAVADLRTARVPDKTADPHYLSAEHRAWRALVIRNAGGRCEWIAGGVRCARRESLGDRMFADHIVERADGGADLDPANGQCLCGRHHTIKTNAARGRREAGQGGFDLPG